MRTSPEAPTPELAATVRAWRETRALSLKQAGRKVGVAHTTIREWERGRWPGPTNLAALEAALMADAMLTCELSIEAMSPLRSARLLQGSSMATAARRAGVSVATLSLWERGQRRPTMRQLRSICTAVDADPNAVAAMFGGCRIDQVPAQPTNQARQYGRNLRHLRRRRSLTQRQLAALSNVSVTRIGRLERGLIPVTLAMARRLAPCYRVDVAEVLRVCGADVSIPRSHWTAHNLPSVLATLRSHHGLSLRELARRTGSSPRTLARYENGDSPPRRQRLAQLERIYQLPPTSLQSVLRGPRTAGPVRP